MLYLTHDSSPFSVDRNVAMLSNFEVREMANSEKDLIAGVLVTGIPTPL